MRGDFSVLHFDPHVNERAVSPAADGVLRNVRGVLHQQGRVTIDADLTEGELIDLAWDGQAGRDIIGAGICAVPAAEPEGFRVESAFAVGNSVHVMLHPGRAWADGLLTRLAGIPPDPQASVERLATYFGPPLANPTPTADSIGDTARDAVILEVSEEALHGFQYPRELIEPALGGPDTSERAFVNVRIRLLRLAEGEDCDTIRDKLRDDPSAKGRLTASLAPVVSIVGDCPVVGGGGYTGFEHNLYRIEIADTPANAPARFKWSQWNGGLAGRARFDATTTPARAVLDAGRASIVNSGLTEFYLEALQYDDLIGGWVVVYGTIATLNTDHDLELASPASFGTLPSTSDSVFIRLWNGISDISAFTNSVNPVELRDGIRLVFDAPAAGNYQPGDYWTFTVRAGEIANPQLLVNDAPPTGIVYHRVALAEIDWTAQRDTRIAGSIEDCRKRFRPLTNQKVCCTFLIGDGVSSFGDFNSLEEAASHLPANGGELCLLPGLHHANLRLEGRRNVKIHGCTWRSMVLPRIDTPTEPILHVIDCVGVEICDLDLVTYDGMAVQIDGGREGRCRDVRAHDNRMIARTNAIRATNVADLEIAGNRLHLLDTVDGRATVSVLADDVLIERNRLLLLPFEEPTTPEDPNQPKNPPRPDPADPCAKSAILYKSPAFVREHAFLVWAVILAQVVAKRPYRAIGGIHVRAGSERVRIRDNQIVGGAGNGITLGGDLDPAAAPAPVPAPAPAPAPAFAIDRAAAREAAVTVTENGQFQALVQDEQGRELSDVDVYLEADTIAADRTDARGMVSVKTAPGPHNVAVSPQYKIVRITEARDQGVLVNAVTLATNDTVNVRGFLYEITIEANHISMMGLSGIGFALREGRDVKGHSPTIPANDPKGALLAYLDTALASLAVTPLLRATDPVRDLVIQNNRLHHNLRNPFGDLQQSQAQFIGFGGISLATVETVVIEGNHIYENGPGTPDPVCGIFVGYGDNLGITENVLAANGLSTPNTERVPGPGIRGGIYIRFAGAVTSKLSTSTGRNAALRVHDNRVDQPVGRALTAYAFGPVSVANNHLNSELTGNFGFIDTFVGGALIVNVGGIHRLLARRFGAYLGHFSSRPEVAGKIFLGVAERALPGGETLFDDNYGRLGLVNRSITSQAVLALDDLSYSSNTSSVYRGDPFFANAVLLADSLRATASRFREDVTQTISLLAMSMRMNMTVLNQGDHCIVTIPPAGAQPLPTVNQPNQVLDSEICQRFAEPAGVWRFLAAVLAADPDRLGGTLTEKSFTAEELVTLSQQSIASAITHINDSQVATTKAYQYEGARLAAKHGVDDPLTQAIKAQAQAGAETNQLLVASAETVRVPIARAPAKAGSVLSGRVANDRGQGLPNYRVDLIRANGKAIDTVGKTDDSGYFTAAYDEARTAALAKEGDLFLRVVDPAEQEVLRDKTTLRFAAGADVQTTLVIPVRVVPKSVATGGTVIFGRPAPGDDTGDGGKPPTPTKPPTKPPKPTNPTEPTAKKTPSKKPKS